MIEFDWTKHCKRWWTYSTEEYDPSWYEKIGWPHRGGDEWGRRTVVIGTRWTGYIVWAYKTCWCNDCHTSREQTYRTRAYTRDGDLDQETCDRVIYMLATYAMLRKQFNANDVVAAAYLAAIRHIRELADRGLSVGTE